MAEEQDGDDDLLFDEDFLLQSLLDVSEALDSLRGHLRPTSTFESRVPTRVAEANDDKDAADAVARGMAQKLDTLFQIAALGDVSSDYLVENGVVELAGCLLSIVAGTEADLEAPGSSTAARAKSAVYECLQLACGLVANLVVVSKACRALLFTQRVEGVMDTVSSIGGAGKRRPVEEQTADGEDSGGSNMHNRGGSSVGDGDGSAARLSFQGFKLLVALLGTIETCRDVRALEEGLRCIYALASYVAIDDATVFAVRTYVLTYVYMSLGTFC